jgi:hypothetical protein
MYARVGAAGRDSVGRVCGNPIGQDYRQVLTAARQLIQATTGAVVGRTSALLTDRFGK